MTTPAKFQPHDEAMFIGEKRGKQCHFQVRIMKQHPNVPDTYLCMAVFAANVHYVCRDWIHESQLHRIEAVIPTGGQGHNSEYVSTADKARDVINAAIDGNEHSQVHAIKRMLGG